MVPTPPYIPARWHGGAQSEIDFIVIHGTVSPTVDGGARSIARFFATEDNQTSAHYVVDPGEVIQCVYDHTIAYHCGHNANSIGVEMCDPVDGPAERWGDEPHLEMLARTADLVRDLCDSYGIPKVKLTPAQLRPGQKGIVGHADVRDAWPGSTTHYDPGPAFPWGQFIALVNGTSAGPTTPEDDEIMFSHQLEHGAGRHTDTITIESDGNSALIQDVYVSLVSGFDGLANVTAFFPGGGDPAAGSPRVLGDLPRDTRAWWKLPKGCFAFSIEWENVSDFSRPSLSFVYTRK